MKKLLGAMASIALLTSQAAIAQPGNQQNQHHENRGGGNRQGPDQQAARHHMDQRQGSQRQVIDRRIDQRRAARRQAANRAYNASTYRTRNYGYADPAQYRNTRVHRGWAQDRGNTYRWSKGERMGYNDWYYAPRVDYRRYRLRRPPFGYEWRRYDDRYVLVAITTGLIMSVILDAGR